MTPTVTSYVERVTIVLNPDGSIKGAMQESLQTIADTSVTPPTILQAQMLPAVPIAPATLAAVGPRFLADFGGPERDSRYRTADGFRVGF